jgi:hypothetical protein
MGDKSMCIMEVRAGQRSSTIAQACAYNTSTVERDLDMFLPLLEARGEHDAASEIRTAQRQLREAYATLLSAFADEITRDVANGTASHEHGNERVHAADEALISDAMHAAAHRAERYETR